MDGISRSVFVHYRAAFICATMRRVTGTITGILTQRRPVSAAVRL
jgi:hypothetical protein